MLNFLVARTYGDGEVVDPGEAVVQTPSRSRARSMASEGTGEARSLARRGRYHISRRGPVFIVVTISVLCRGVRNFGVSIV